MHIKLLILHLLLWPALVQAASIQGGDVVGRNIFGLALDYQGDPVLVEDRPLVFASGQADIDLSLDQRRFTVSSFDHVIGNVFITEYDHERDVYLDTVSVDLAPIGGVSGLGASLQTSWNSVLLSESTLVDAANHEAFARSFSGYFKNKQELVRPYNYGYALETILLNEKGEAKVIKNYASGRVFASQLLMMPDGKTLYLLDSKYSGNLYIFVAEQPNSLAKGQLFVTKMTKNRVSLVELGKSSALKMKFKLKKMDFSGLFERVPVKDDKCDSGFARVDTVYGKECLKQVRKNRRYTGLFEPIRMAALKGVNGFGVELDSLGYDAANNQLQLSSKNGSSWNLGLGSRADILSEYLITE
jgi:hypothetical protein